MDNGKYAKWFGAVGVIAWLSALYLLFPLPSAQVMEVSASDPIMGVEAIREEEKRLGMAPGELMRTIKSETVRKENALWVRWWLLLIGIVSGAAAGMHALRRGTHWPYFTALTSTAYLLAWWLTLRSYELPSHSGVLDTYIASLTYGFSANSVWVTLIAIHRELLLPLLHLFFVSFLIYLGVASSSRGSGESR
jgi:hypothetical protein